MLNNTIARNLFVFVESPNKVKIFEQVLKKYYKEAKVYTIATKGHISSIDASLITQVEQNLTIKYKKHAATIINKMKNCNYNPELDFIFFATDPDREGEAISWHLKKLLQLKFKHINYARIRCNSLTEASIISHIKQSSDSNCLIDKNLIDAYFTRITIDLLIGINGSKMLWQKLYGCRSIGRVQSIVIYMLLEKEIEIQKFVPKKYKKLSITIPELPNVKIDQITYDGVCITKLSDEEREFIYKRFNGSKFVLSQTTSTIMTKNKIIPLDIANLSSIANAEYNMSINELYTISQKLYEGIDYKGTKLGLITYMRTDSHVISDEFIKQIYEFINLVFGPKLAISPSVNQQKTIKKAKNAQEAHEAIRITDLKLDLPDIAINLNIKERKIMQQVFVHTVAPFMISPKFKKIIYKFVNEKCCIYITSYSLLEYGYYRAFDYIGHKYVLPQKIEEMQSEITVTMQLTDTITSNFSRYTEGSLIAKMKKLGIGRPSTYSYITNVIKNRSYSVISQGKYYLLSAGFILAMFIECFLSEVISYEFTSKMEQSLDAIVNQQTTKKDVLDKFFHDINNKFNHIMNSFDREIILAKLQKLLYERYGDKCTAEQCQNTYQLKFIHSQARIVCDKHITNLNKFGYKNDNYLKYEYKTKFQNKFTSKNKNK